MLQSRGFLNNIHDVDYNLSITYLETGVYPDNYDDYDILGAVVDDFDCICSDYGVE